MKINRLALCALVLLASACAPAAAGNSADTPRTGRVRRDLITREQIIATEQHTLFDAIQRLQPSWLVPQGTLDTVIGVFVDGTSVGGIDFLRQYPATQAQEVRFLNNRAIGAELTTRQAAGLGSAIMITSPRM
jgi:hypothetical protein